MYHVKEKRSSSPGKGDRRTKQSGDQERHVRKAVIVDDSDSYGDSVPDDTTDGIETVYFKKVSRRSKTVQEPQDPSDRTVVRQLLAAERRALCKKLVVLFLIMGVIALVFFVGSLIVQNKEDEVVKTVSENMAYCIPNRIQDRADVTLYLALTGVTADSECGDLESVVEPAVAEGYNRASGECSDSCNRWAYLSRLENCEDMVDENTGATTGKIVGMKTYLSEYGCAPGESFVSNYPNTLVGTRRHLKAIKRIDLGSRYSDVTSPALEASSVSSVPNQVAATYYSPLAFVTSNGDDRDRRLQDRELNFDSVMGAIEDELYAGFRAAGIESGFAGIEEVIIVQKDRWDQPVEGVYTRAGSSGASFHGFERGPTGKDGSKGSKGSKSMGTFAPTSSPAPTSVSGSTSKGKGSKGSKKGGTAAPTLSAPPTPCETSNGGKGSKGKGSSTSDGSSKKTTSPSKSSKGKGKSKSKAFVDDCGPTAAPSSLPSGEPTESSAPSAEPSDVPSTSPSASPSDTPSQSPSASPSDTPSQSPSTTPSITPTTLDTEDI